MNRTPLNSWLARYFNIMVLVLAVSGLAQMPIFKRYYIADVPGLGWLADFYFTHKLHYVAAALLLFFMGWVAVHWVKRWKINMRLTSSGVVRLLILAVIVVTGAMRMYKNQPGISMGPFTVMIVDWVHLAAVMLLGAVAVGFRAVGLRAYASKRG